jgi:hypothetical protein
MKAFLVLVVLLLVVPMIVLNPLGRSAFLGYYAGVIATWAVFAVVAWHGQSKHLQRAHVSN